MHQRRALIAIGSVCVLVCARPAHAQLSATYHLHKEASKTSGLLQLKVAGPDAGAATIASPDFKKLAAGEYIVKAFDTAAGVPNAAGTIAAGSVLSFTLWMKKSANAAVMYPRAKVFLNSPNGAALCAATGSNALTTAITAHTLNCTTTAAVAMSTADRFYLWIGVQVTTAPANVSVKAQLSVEGALNGNYDSRIVVPHPTLQPSIIALSPTSAPVGAAVTIGGSNFGSSRGTSRVTFNGIAATATSWTATSITAPVPPAAASGPVVVTVGGLASNPFAFVVITDGSVDGVVSNAIDGSALAGALVELLQNDTWVAQATTGTNGEYALGPVIAGTYALRVSATGMASATRQSVEVFAGSARTENFELTPLGRISGRVAESSTNAAIGGATVTAVRDGVTRSSESDATGSYAIVDVPAGAYAVGVRANGFRRAPASTVDVTDGIVTTHDVALERGRVAYAYDELDRLIAVVDASGISASYRYDAAGNILSIARQSGDTPSIFSVSPRSGPAGSAITIAGAAFSEGTDGNIVRFSGTTAPILSASETQIVAAVPAGAVSGPVTVSTHDATATSPYAFDVAADDGRPTITGFSPPIVDAGAAIVVTGSHFDVQAGSTRVSQNRAALRAVSVRADAVEATMGPDATSGHVEVRTPAGAALSDGFVFVAPPHYSAGDIGFTASVAVGGTVQVPELSDKLALIAFDGIAGQRIGVRQETSASKLLLGPQGRVLGWLWSFLAATLPVDGTYTVVQYPCYDWCAGAAPLSLAPVPSDVTAAITIDDPPFPFDLTAIGQRARLTFTARRRQHIAITMNEGTTYLYASVLDANGFNYLRYPEYFDENTPLDVVLPEAGVYTLLLDPERLVDSGHFSVAVRDVADVVVALEIDGGAVTAITTEPEQDIYASFSGAAGDRISFVVSDVTLPAWSELTITAPDGSILVRQSIGTGASPDGGWVEFDLPATGTYAVFIDVQPDASGGNVTLEAIARPPDLTAPIEIDGAPVRFSIDQRGQNAVATFDGIAGQRLTIRLTEVTVEGLLGLYRDGEPYSFTNWYVWPSAGQAFETTLPATGPYRLLVDPLAGQTGAVTLSIATR